MQSGGPTYGWPFLIPLEFAQSMEQLINTKLNIPRIRKALVPRPRLLDRLSGGLQGKLALVSAPAGFGKTTLAIEWIQTLSGPVAWLTLDEGDNDPLRFINYLVKALQVIDEKIGLDIQSVLQTSSAPQLDILLTMLINELVSVHEPFVLVLDDCHLITDHSIYDSIDFLIDHMPLGMHLVLVGRVDPPIPYSRLRVGGQLTEIRSNDLRFTKAEIGSFLNELMGLNLSGEDISALEKRTEGWVASLQLAALSMQDRTNKHQFIADFSGSHRYVIEYLMEEVLSQQSEDLKSFLYRTSILEYLTAGLCNDVLKISHSQEILKHLMDANLFLIPLDDVRGWYRYHHLFSDFLRRCLEEIEPEIISRLHSRAGRWFEQKGYIDEAVKHALSAEDFPEAARIIEEMGEMLLERSELAKLMKLVRKVPNEAVRARPALCVFHAWALRLSGAPYQEVETRLEDAEEAIQEGVFELHNKDRIETNEDFKNDGDNLKCQIMAVRAFQAVYIEDLPRAVELAKRVKACLPNESFARSSIGNALGWAYRFSGDLELAVQAFSEVTENALESGNIYMAVACKSRAAFAMVVGGNLIDSMANFQGAVDTATRENGRQFPVIGYPYVYMGGVYYEWNELDTAARYLVEGIEGCWRVGYIMDQVVGYAYLVRVRLAQKNWDEAREALSQADQLRKRMKGYIYVQRWFEDCQVRYWLARGDLDAVARWVEESGLRIDDDLDYKRDLEHIILARALVSLGRERSDPAVIDDALSLLRRLLKMGEEKGWGGKVIEILVLQALGLAARNRSTEALKTLERALRMGSPEGYVRTFADEGEPMAELLRSLQAKDKRMNSYIKKILSVIHDKKLPIVKESTLAHSHFSQSCDWQPLIEPLSKRELEILKLLTTDLSGPEIARELMVALSTVRYHTNNIYSKLAVHSRMAAIHKAQELELL